MDAMKQQLQALCTRALAWGDRIKKTTFASSVCFSPNSQTGEFSITTHWVTRSGEKGAYTKQFTRDLVFGPAERRTAQPRVLRTLCSYMKEYMHEVLRSRGV